MWLLRANRGKDTHIYEGGETQNYPIAGETQLANPGVCTPSPNRDTGIARFVSLVQCKFGAVLVIGLHTCKIYIVLCTAM